MHRPAALAIVAVLWAAIYLPGLGSTEIKGEEGRRILPAITMLETGNWLVPYIGGEPYLRKPPLVNWLIALSFKISGVRNEWTARLPSTLCVLALGCVIVAVSGRGWMNVETSLMAAILAMTQFGLLAKAKFVGAEIEGIYAPLTGMAIVCWLAWRAQGRSPWLVWTVPGALLGLACLAKGPSLHLLYYYAIVLAVLWRAKELRQLVHPAHLAGLALCAGVFAAWAVPYFRTPEAVGAAEVWKRQGLDRFTDSDFNLTNYLTNVPRALGDQLPWLLLVPVLFSRSKRKTPNIEHRTPNIESTADAPSELPSTFDVRRSMFGVLAATLLCFLCVLLVPGTLPRYVLPLGTPIALLLAAAVVRSGRFPHPEHLAIKVGAAFGVAMLLYSALIVPRMNARDDLRPVARAIDAAIPAGERLIIHDPGYLAAIFYLRTPYRYAPRTEDIPADAAWVLTRGGAVEKLQAKLPDLRIDRTLGAGEKRPPVLLRRE